MVTNDNIGRGALMEAWEQISLFGVCFLSRLFLPVFLTRRHINETKF